MTRKASLIIRDVIINFGSRNLAEQDHRLPMAA